MKFLDEKFKTHKKQFLFQSALGGVTAGAVLCLFDIVKNPIIVASFGASAFIAFSLPHREISRPRFLIGGYLIGILVGMLMYNITRIPVEDAIIQKALYVTAGIFAVTLAMFLMGITNTEHAPGASIALGFTLNPWTMATVVLVITGIIMVTLIQRFLKRWMIDLI